jgi:hypothetical protein
MRQLSRIQPESLYHADHAKKLIQLSWLGDVTTCMELVGAGDVEGGPTSW